MRETARLVAALPVARVLGELPPLVEAISSDSRAAGAGTMFVALKEGKRANADAIIARLRPKLAQIEGLTLFLQATQDVRVGGRLARTQYQYTLQDADLEELRAWGPKVVERLRNELANWEPEKKKSH